MKSNIFKDLNSEDFREFIVFIFCALAFLYMFIFSWVSVPEDNHQYVNQGFTICAMILGKLLMDFVSGKAKSNKINEDEEILND